MAIAVPTKSGRPVVGPRLEGSGVNGGFSPADLRSAYDLPAQGGETSETVAITDAYGDPNANSDLNTYRKQYGLGECSEANGCFAKVNQKGKPAEYPETQWEWTVETSIDLDMVSAVCPKCHILLVEADNAQTENLLAAVAEAAQLGATAISDSYGGEELPEESTLDPALDHPGVPVLFASGDSAYGVEYPAASPDVIAVGGTSLHREDKSARGWRETAWVDAGSGCSAYEDKPVWQTDPGCSKRTVADVSAVADPDTPVSTYDSNPGPEKGWLLYGGTSVATPILAGVEALSSAADRAQAARLFWEEGPAGKLFDVTEGRNGFCPGGASYLCTAGMGYDGPTGWGTPGASRPGPPVLATEPAVGVSEDTATLQGAVNPNGADTTYRFEYGPTTAYGTSIPALAGAAGSGTEVAEIKQQLTGLPADATYHYRLVASNDLGSTYGGDQTFETSPWSVQSTGGVPWDGRDGAAVSCGSATFCMSVGALEDYFNGPGSNAYNDEPRAESWNGGEWAADSVPAEHQAADGYASWLSGVSCISTGACMAIGRNYEIEKGYQPLAEWWDGSVWSIVPTPMPSEAGVNPSTGQRESGMNGISCVSASFCVAVGYFVKTWYPEEEDALIMTWDGNGWTVQPSPDPAKPAGVVSIDSRLRGVSCLSSTSCVAVGEQTDVMEKGSGEQPIVERWDGSGWSLQASPSVSGGLRGVSCNSAQACMAVGETGGTGLTETWNGTTWSRSQAPRHVLRGVSCLAADWCVGVGEAGQNESAEAVAEQWNGTGWIAQRLGHPADRSDKPWGLNGVSCLPSGCTAVGWYWSYGYKLLAEHSLPTAITYTQSLTHYGNPNASFSEPNAVAVDPSGNIWVTESGQDRVLEFTESGEPPTQLGSEGSGLVQFKGIGGIAANSKGDVYVTDSGNARVQELGPSGEYIRSFGSNALHGGQLLDPTAIAIDGSGNVWVLNAVGSSGDRIVEFSGTGAELTKFGENGSGEGQLGVAYGLAISGGNLYVAEGANSRVQEFSSTGEYIRAFDPKGSGNGESNVPSAIATEPISGDLYVSEAGSDIVQVFSAEGTYITSFGSPGSGAGQLSDPRGLAMNSSGTVYVADSGNRRIEEWAPGLPPTYTQSLTHYESPKASFSEPDAEAVDPSGNIWVTESGQDRVLEFNASSTLIGQLGSEGSGQVQFKGIGGIAANSNGDVYVTDSGNARVQELGPSGEYIRSFGSNALHGGQLLDPTAIAIDGSGNVWVLNAVGSSGDRIVEFSGTGAELTKFGENGSGEGQLGVAYGLAISGGNLYVAEGANSRVQEFSSTGEYIRAFDPKGSGNGESNVPSAIATEPISGDLYVSEAGSDTVQVFSAEGTYITSLAPPAQALGSSQIRGGSP